MDFTLDDEPEQIIKESWTHSKGEYNQRIFRGLKIDKKLWKKKRIAKAEAIETILATISKGLILLGMMIGDNDINVTEWKNLNNIVSEVLPRYTIGGEELKCKKLWSTYKRYISRSNRRTNWWRLQEALQSMGNEIPELKIKIEELLVRLYDKQLCRLKSDKMRGRQEWREAQNQKPEVLEVLGA